MRCMYVKSCMLVLVVLEVVLVVLEMFLLIVVVVLVVLEVVLQVLEVILVVLELVLQVLELVPARKGTSFLNVVCTEDMAHCGIGDNCML